MHKRSSIARLTCTVLLACAPAYAQISKHDDTDIHTLMSLESQAAKRKLMAEIGRPDGAASITVPPILPMGMAAGGAAAAAAPAPMTPAAVPVPAEPVTESVYGIRPDYQADLLIGGVRYSAMKPGMKAGRYTVRSVTADGVLLEDRAVVVSKQGKAKAPAQGSMVYAPRRES